MSAGEELGGRGSLRGAGREHGRDGAQDGGSQEGEGECRAEGRSVCSETEGEQSSDRVSLPAYRGSMQRFARSIGTMMCVCVGGGEYM